VEAHLTSGAFSDKLSQVLGKYWTCIDAAFLWSVKELRVDRTTVYSVLWKSVMLHWGSSCEVRCGDISLTYLHVVYGIQFVGLQLQIWRRSENLGLYTIYLIRRGRVYGCFAKIRRNNNSTKWYFRMFMQYESGPYYSPWNRFADWQKKNNYLLSAWNRIIREKVVVSQLIMNGNRFHDVTKTASPMSLHNLKYHPLTFILYYPRIYA